MRQALRSLACLGRYNRTYKRQSRQFGNLLLVLVCHCILEDFPSHPVTEPFGFTKALGALSRNNIENTERALKGSEVGHPQVPGYKEYPKPKTA